MVFWNQTDLNSSPTTSAFAASREGYKPDESDKRETSHMDGTFGFGLDRCQLDLFLATLNGDDH